VHVSKATREYAQVSPFVVRGTPAKDAMAQCSVYSCGPGMVADSPMERTVAPHTSWSLSPSGISSHANKVATIFFATTSQLPGNAAVDLYSADNWLYAQFLNLGSHGFQTHPTNE
jgi:hypothetical protein